jgi:hypothetical protein
MYMYLTANVSCCFVFFFFWRFQGLQELEQIDGKARQLLYGLVFLLHCLALQIQQTLAGFRLRVKAWQSACVFASVFNASSTNPCRILGLGFLNKFAGRMCYQLKMIENGKLLF